MDIHLSFEYNLHFFSLLSQIILPPISSNFFNNSKHDTFIYI
jgi:hypothetical protein